MNATLFHAATGLVASRAWSAGQPRTTPEGRPLAGVFPASDATYPIGGGDDEEVAAAIGAALDRVEPMAPALDALGPGLRRQFFIGWWLPDGMGGDILAPELLGRLARMSIELSLDSYAAVTDEG